MSKQTSNNQVRERSNISLKTPVKEVLVVSKDPTRLHHLDDVKPYILQVRTSFLLCAVF